MSRTMLAGIALLGLGVSAAGAIALAGEAPVASANSAQSGEVTLRRNVLFVGGKTLAGWRQASPELFGLPQMHVLVVSNGRTAEMLARFRRALLDADVDVVNIMPDISAARAEGIEQMQQNIAAMVDISLAHGKRVLLSRPIEPGGSKNPAAEESIAGWMQQLALDRGLGFGDYRNWPFAQPLAESRSLADRTEALQTALDDVFRAQAGVDGAERSARYAAWQSAQPDGPGSGPYPAVRAIDPALPSHTFYRPANLVPFQDRKLPVLIWANGGCGDDSAFSRPFLTEIASQGYLVIALGAMKSGPGATGRMRDATGPDGVPTTTRDMLAALDWVTGLTTSQVGWSQYLDVASIAAAGYSCGGVLALDIARDKRIRTAVILNSGVFRATLPGVTMKKSELSQLQGPVLYVLGGPTDVAYFAALDDMTRLTHIPVAVVSREVGHGGTYWATNGGSFAQVTVAWLDWHLKAQSAKRDVFVGKSCGLCKDANWQVKTKGF
ncbi:MAG: hypothetical protein ABI859_15625 [Pseudomonadota bacterium]